MQALTNAQLAAHFASKPPDEEATVYEVDVDTGTMQAHSLYILTEAYLTENVEDGQVDAEAINQPGIVVAY